MHIIYTKLGRTTRAAIISTALTGISEAAYVLNGS